MKAKKLPSGNWNIRVYDYKDEQGKIHTKSITAPTKAEAEYMAAQFKTGRTKKVKDYTLRDAVKKYISLSQNLSPTTLHSYDRILAFAFPSIMDMPLNKITQEILQRAVNQEGKRLSERNKRPLSPKTVNNEYSLISAALKNEGIHFAIKLPRTPHTNSDLPEPKDIINAIKGTDIELPCLLAMWCGLRMSEIRGLTGDSVKGDYLSIDKVVVDVGSEKVLKYYGKTDSSIRKVIMPNYIKERINSLKLAKNEFINCDSRAVIYHKFQKIMKANGLDISFHDLRHEYASIMLTKLSIPSRIVQDEGGWHTDATMKKVYSQSFSESRKEAARKRDDYFESLF